MKRTPVLILLALILVLSSCVTKSPIGDQMYMQGLGLDGEFVITVNAHLLDVEQFIQTDDPATKYILERMDRLSIALQQKTAPDSPITSDFSEYDYYGAIEGSFSKTLVNSALSLGSRFTSKKQSGLKFFVDEVSGLEAAIPANGIILFSSTDVVANRDRTFVENRQTHISQDDASKLASSQFGLYVSNPRTMIDLGFDLTEDALKNISSVLMVMDDETISMEFRLKSEKLADSFSVLIKAGYVGNLRREGVKLDMDALRMMFTQELDKVNVNGMKLSAQQKESIEKIVASLLQIL